MASRPAFLSGARSSSAKPKERPRREPRKPPQRKPPDRKLPPDRRPPGRKPLRRPEPKKPLPRRPLRRPLFPVKPLPKTKPFGKWIPNTGIPMPPMRRWQALKLLRLGRGFLGPLGVALTLWELYEIYQWYQGQEGGLWPPPSDTYRWCSDRNASTWPFGPFGRFAGPTLSCTEGLDWSSTVERWEPGRPWFWFVQRRQVTGGRYRTKPMEGWLYPEDPGVLPEIRPDLPPVVLPPEKPYPYPDVDEPLPWTPPLERPEPEPRPDYDRPPWRRSDADPDPLMKEVPDIELIPGEPLSPGKHERRPPEPPEKEKKKRLKTKDSYKWLKFLNDSVGTFTELDDTVTAIYKALDWKVRRWKGRDGVWRDRDINTKSRLQRLLLYTHTLDLTKAVEEIMKAHNNKMDENLKDKLYGAQGERLKRKSRELGEEGIWGGFQGLGQNPNRFNDDWDTVYKRLKKEAAERQHRYGHNWYYSKKYDPVSNTWNGVWRQRPITQIPWYRQKSAYDRWVNLTGQKTGYKVKRSRYYYARTGDEPSPFYRD